MKKIWKFINLLFLFMAMWSSACFADSTPTQSTEGMTVTLIGALKSGADPDIFTLALDVHLDEGWHTYWRSPGAGGAPPALDSSKSVNIQRAELLFPTPKRETFFGMDSLIYSEQVTFPIKVKLADHKKPATANFALDIYICQEMCVPKHFEFSLDVSASRSMTQEETTRLQKALGQLPSSENSATLRLDSLNRAENKIYANISAAEGILAPDMLIETPKQWAFSKPEISIDNDKKTASLIVQMESDIPAGASLTTTPLTVTILNDGKALELKVSEAGEILSSSPSSPPLQKASKETTGATSLLWALLMALVGGLILNLMPCVLPVLSLKILSVIKHGGAEQKKIRHSFLSTGAGIVFSFLIIAVATWGLKSAGQAVGWGVQFQQPVFLVFMITLLILFAANLWGFMNISLPRFIMDNLDAHYHPKLAGDFATGALATLLATPCSAPFLGTAITYALTQGGLQIIAIFLMMGIGMAAPYLMISAKPSFAGNLPKPGRWMGFLTKGLAAGLLLTALWLVFILRDQIGALATRAVVVAMFGLLIALFLRHKNFLPRLSVLAALLAISGACAASYLASVPPSVAKDSGVWVSFDEEALHRHVREGKVVFLDITADWCLTCKVNKRVTLSSSDVAPQIFGAENVIAMQGDWTTPDAAINDFLQKQGRYGIPFNAVYGPQAPEGILLPELLSPTKVLKALKDAGAPSKACPPTLPAGKEC